MFLSHISIALELIAISIGAALLIWSLRSEGAGTVLAKSLGIVIITLATFDLLSTAYSTVLYNNFAYYRYSSFMMPYGQQNSGISGYNNPTEVKTSATCPMCAAMEKDHKKSQNTAGQSNQDKQMTSKTPIQTH